MKITSADNLGFGVRVFLNGVEQKYCFIADDEAGYVVVGSMKDGREGKPVFRQVLLESNMKGLIEYENCVCEVLTGKVEIQGVRLECPHCRAPYTGRPNRCPACERLIG